MSTVYPSGPPPSSHAPSSSPATAAAGAVAAISPQQPEKHQYQHQQQPQAAAAPTAIPRTQVTPSTPLLQMDSPLSNSPPPPYSVIYFTGDFPSSVNHSPSDSPVEDVKAPRRVSVPRPKSVDISEYPPAGPSADQLAAGEMDYRQAHENYNNYNSQQDGYPPPVMQQPQQANSVSPESVPLINMAPGYPEYRQAVNNKYMRIHLIDPHSLGEIMLADGHQKDIEQLKDPDDEVKPKGCAHMHYCVGFWSAFGHIGVCLCTILVVWQANIRKDLKRPSDAYTKCEAWLICSGVFLAVSYLIIIIEGLVSDTFTYLDTYMNVEELMEFMDKIRTTMPIIKWTVTCYHHETKKDKEKDKKNTSDKRAGDTGHILEADMEDSKSTSKAKKVTTYTEEEIFRFTHCTDASGNLDGFDDGTVTRLDLEKTFGFLDHHTIDEFVRRKHELQERNRSRDRFMDLKEEFTLEGHKPLVAVFPAGGRHWLMKRRYFLIATCFFLTWPYRFWFEKRIRKRKFTFVKLIGV